MWAEEKKWRHVAKSMKQGKFELNNMFGSLQVQGREHEKKILLHEPVNLKGDHRSL